MHATKKEGKAVLIAVLVSQQCNHCPAKQACMSAGPCILQPGEV